MGWIFSPERAYDSVTERVRADLDSPSYTLLDAKQIGRAVYSAVRKESTEEVFGLVSLIERPGDGTIGLKHMDEAMRPFADECPMRILRLLTPTTNPRALAWREACLAQHRDDPVYSSLAEGAGQ